MSMVTTWPAEFVATTDTTLPLELKIAADALPAVFVRVYMSSASGLADDLLVKLVLVPMNDNVPFCCRPRAVGSPLCENPSRVGRSGCSRKPAACSRSSRRGRSPCTSVYRDDNSAFLAVSRLREPRRSCTCHMSDIELPLSLLIAASPRDQRPVPGVTATEAKTAALRPTVSVSLRLNAACKGGRTR